MCNLSDGVWEQAMEKGVQQGIEQGIKQGIEQGIQQGALENSISNIRNLMDTMNLTADEAMRALRTSSAIRDEYYRRYPN